MVKCIKEIISLIVCCLNDRVGMSTDVDDVVVSKGYVNKMG